MLSKVFIPQGGAPDLLGGSSCGLIEFWVCVRGFGFVFFGLRVQGRGN